MGNNHEASFKGVIVTISDYKNELKKRLLIILSAAIIFSLLGFGFSKLQEDKYNAVISFIVEEQSEGVNLPGITGMANMIGLDLGGANTTSSFNQQNIIELLKSRKIIERTLNNTCEIAGNFCMISSFNNGAKDIYGECHFNFLLLHFSKTLSTSSSFNIGAHGLYQSLCLILFILSRTSIVFGTATKDR